MGSVFSNKKAVRNNQVATKMEKNCATKDHKPIIKVIQRQKTQKERLLNPEFQFE